jgi:hypothetical protein
VVKWKFIYNNTLTKSQSQDWSELFGNNPNHQAMFNRTIARTLYKLTPQFGRFNSTHQWSHHNGNGNGDGLRELIQSVSADVNKNVSALDKNMSKRYEALQSTFDAIKLHTESIEKNFTRQLDVMDTKLDLAKRG